MLHQVVEYAQRQELAAEPGFAPKSARWAILCTASGKYQGLVEVGDTSLKRNPGRHFSKAPDLSQPEMKAGGITKSHFLIDTAGVVAGYGKDAPEEKHQYFVELLEQAKSSMPVLGAVANMLRGEDNLAGLRKALEQRKAKATDKVTFQIDGQFPADSDEWHPWWREFRRGLQTSKEQGRKVKSAKMLCFLTGELVEPAATHPKITGLTSVGGLAMGDVLIGFKQESFRSYGLEQSANAAMSELAAKGYQAGLNDLIANHSVMLAGTLVTHWFRTRIAMKDDPMDWIMLPSEADDLNAQVRARKLIESIRSGQRVDLASNTYYALTISSNGGRVVIRDWMEGDFTDLVENVNRWFSDLEIVHRDGGGSAKPPKFGAVLAALVRELKDVAPPMAVKLYRVAAAGEPIPLAAMTQALARVRVDVIQGERPNHARMGLIKAYHVRKWRQEGGSMQGQMKPELSRNLQDRAYQCGRLMAVLSGLQAEALPDVKAGVIQRYYAAASTTPALVFGRLVRGAQPHLSKLISDQKKGLKIWYERQMSEICGKIGTSMPATLSLEDQSLFALGYYQQLAALWTGKDTDKEKDEKGDE
jgi:CRISPR-associated protein Csd1